MTEEIVQYSEELQASSTHLGARLRARFDELSNERFALEQRWLTDLRQYKGIYDPDVESKIQKNKSKTFIRATRTKVKAFNSRLMEMLFPSNRDRNWDIEPTPLPEMAMVTPEIEEALQRFVEHTEREPDDKELREIFKEVAEEACESMKEEMDDQLKQVKYREICRKVIHSGNLYGTGVLKAPMVQRKNRVKWGLDETGEWGITEEEVLLPFLECVSIWDFYPDLSANEIDEISDVYQRHAKTKEEALELAKLPEFNEELIKQYLKDFPEGDYTVRSFRTELDETNSGNDTVNTNKKTRFEFVECWTPLSSDEMAEAELEEGQTGWVNVWMLGPFVVRSVLAPLPGLDHPYHLYYFDKDETSIFGEGIASIMRDDQVGLNAVTRGMLDNAARTVGDMYEVNAGKLVAGEESREVYPGRVFVTKGDGRDPAVRSINHSSRTSEFLTIKDMFTENIHENTVPSYMHGDQASGVGRTVGGLSMLMGAANINIKDQVQHFDDGISLRAIPAIYHWNMKFNERTDIKGDFEIKARGSSSLVAKELRVQHLDYVLAQSNNERDSRFVDRRKLWEETLMVRDLGGSDIIYSEEDYNEHAEKDAQLQQLTQQVGATTLLLDELDKVAPELMKQAQETILPKVSAMNGAGEVG